MTGIHQLPALHFWRRSWARSTSNIGIDYIVLLFVVILAAQLSIRWLLATFGVWSIVGIAVFCVVGVVVLRVLRSLRYPPAVLDFDAGMLRNGSQSTLFAEIADACVLDTVSKRGDELYLWFGAPDRRHTLIPLRERGKVLSPSDREALAAMVERSSIQIPSTAPSPFDAKRGFAVIGGRHFATKAEVRGAVLHTTAGGDVARA